MADLKVAHIWAARVTNEDEIEKIFEEIYGSDNNPISEFAESQGEWFYDHDFLYAERLLENIENTLKSITIPVKNIPAISNAWNSKIDSSFNYLIAGDVDDFENPKSVKIGSTEIIYVGKFKHW